MSSQLYHCQRCLNVVSEEHRFCLQCGEPRKTTQPHGWMQRGTPQTNPQLSQSSSQPFSSPNTQQPSAGLPATFYQPSASVQTPVQQPQYVIHQHVAVQQQFKSSPISTTAMVFGIIQFCLFLIGLIPCLGWLNWFQFLLFPITKILAIVGLIAERNNVPSPVARGVIGIILGIISLFFGTIRLALGGGLF